MIWLILQMLLCLALAAALGLALGWWLRSLGVDDKRRRENREWEERLADYKERLEACQTERQKLAGRLAACEERSAELARRLAAALADCESTEAAALVTEPDSPDTPPVSPERWVVTGDESPGDEDT